MLMLRRGVLAVALVGASALGLATSASAQRPFSTGFYIGANAGAAWGDSALGTSVPRGNVPSGAAQNQLLVPDADLTVQTVRLGSTTS